MEHEREVLAVMLAREESGMTLPEVLVSMSIGMVISLAAFGLV